MPISLHTSSPCTSPPVPRCPSSSVNRDKSLHGDRSMGPVLVVGEMRMGRGRQLWKKERVVTEQHCSWEA
ncbi:hypothetical protein CLOP_g19536 [Closterium sp. NIES-67]|nr:hypothetical protein CLOP_g19536 [Closterium sp. NIES-67]